ncbi:Abi family protein [Microvirga flavescens]|uniref:Abi family protein n=1 Tax=Microvirga flavescens TaxID=2249811 RepID=UPI000DD6B7E9|nr:Abi family protein [Microvirga flavescens]
MEIPDTQKAHEYLTRIGYYRLSAYWYPFRETVLKADGTVQALDTFKPDTSFKTAVDLYAFDKALRLQLLDVLERIEIAVRTSVSLRLGAYDPFAHRNGAFLDGRFARPDPKTGRVKHSEWLQKLDDKEVSSKEEFADHFRTKYHGSHMPVWIAVELLDFGPLSHFLAGMRWVDKSAIATQYGVPKPDLFVSWIRALSVARNVCAHHARLWNKPLVDQPKMPAHNEIPILDHLVRSPYRNTRLYAACALARYMLLVVNPRTKWPSRLKEHLKTFPRNPHISLQSSGFPRDWENLPLWQ